MRCYVHSEKEAVGACVKCGRFICEECNVEIDEKSICKNCIENRGNEIKHGRNRHKHNYRKGESHNETHRDIHKDMRGRQGHDKDDLNFIGHSDSRVKKSRFILFLFTFFTPTGINYLYLGLKKRAMFFMALYFSTFAVVITPMYIVANANSWRFRNATVGLVHAFILLFVFMFGYIFKLAVYHDTLRIRKKMSKGVKVQDTVEDLTRYLSSYKMLMRIVAVSMFILPMYNLITARSFITEMLVIAIMVSSFIFIVMGIPFLVFKSFRRINCVSAQKHKCSELANVKVKKNVKPINNETKTNEQGDLLKRGKILANKLNEKRDSLYYTNIGNQVDEIAIATNKMFGFIEKNPNKARELNKFIEYYMPTTLELLNNYENFQDQNLQGKNVDKSLQKIESTMDNLVLAFRKQLDILFEENALNIDAEINVLNDLLKREGLLED